MRTTRVYADTSFIVKLLGYEKGGPAAISEYRRLGRPKLFYLPLHDLEVTNAILQRAFHQRRTAPASQRRSIEAERLAALSLLGKYISNRAFIEISCDLGAGFASARALAEKHTGRLGCRGLDLLHVAFALALQSEIFFTADRVQSALAKAEGLEVVLINQDDRSSR